MKVPTEVQQMQPMSTLSLEQAAIHLVASPKFVAKLARQGDIPACKVGRSWVFRLIDLDAYLNSRIQARATLNRIVASKPGRARRALPTLI